MRKECILHYIVITLFVIAGFIAGIYLLFPTKAILDNVIADKSLQLAEKNSYLTVRNTTVDNMMTKHCTVHGLRVEMSTAGIEVDRIEFTPAITSLFTGGVKAHVVTGRGSITLITRQKITWNRCTFDIKVNDSVIEIKDINVTGELKARGTLLISRRTGKIIKSEMTLTVPEELDKTLSMVERTKLMPLRKNSPGMWKVVR